MIAGVGAPPRGAHAAAWRHCFRRCWPL